MKISVVHKRGKLKKVCTIFSYRHQGITVPVARIAGCTLAAHAGNKVIRSLTLKSPFIFSVAYCCRYRH